MISVRMDKKPYEWKPMSTRLAERPKTRWKNDINGYLRIIKLNNASRKELNGRK
jgi:hypothetical protein